MYESLYRKYRPKNLDQIVGQEKIVEILKNQIIHEKIGHAYLFTGVRGTGKTSVAKILARAFNCLNLQNGNPCNECKSCISILSGNNTDIIEMDAASNNGVDDIREIIDESAFLPTASKYRVYIIDEVHMLSMGAFNALLKTLEEPPAHVKFILATTDPQKLPATILSRCQRFEFTKISEEKIFNLLNKISDDIELDAEEEALKMLSILAKGSARDAISLLESIKNLEGKITVEKVKSILGIPETKKIIEIFNSILTSEERKLSNNTQELLDEGKEPITILTELLDLIYVIYMGLEEELFKYEESVRSVVQKYFSLDKLEVYKIIKKILKIVSDIKFIENKNIMMKTGLLNILQENIGNEYLSKSLKFSERDFENTKSVKEVMEKKSFKEAQDLSLNFKKEDTKKKEDKVTEKGKNTAKKTEKTDPKTVEQSKAEELKEDLVNKTIEEKSFELTNSEKITPKEVINIENNEGNAKKEEKQVINEQEKKESKAETETQTETQKEIKIEKENNKESQNKKAKITPINTLKVRKKMLENKKTPLFVALSNVKMYLEGDILKINIKDETNEKNLETLNSNESIKVIEEVVSKELKKEINVEYIYE